ncbi:MAG: hypothetical protein U0270_04250 [Labilithrix sp.]
MRSFVRHGLIVGTCLGALLASAGCEQKKATEYVTGVSTQVTVPKYLKAVRIQIANKGFVEFAQVYRVYDGKVLLPRSLGNFPSTSDGNRNTITFSIIGLSEAEDENPTNPVFTDPIGSYPVGQNKVRILRRSTQPYIPDHIKFLPMALKYSCFDKSCNENETCKGGVCVSDIISEDDAKKLEDYTDGMGDGTDGACFSMPVCMGAAIPAVPVNPADCTFAVAESADANAIATLPKDKNPFRPACTAADASAKCGPRNCTDGQCELLPPGSPPWTGVNVEITYDGGQTKEILDLDKDEGFVIPDPAKPQTFKLAPGLCQMLKGKDDGGTPTAHRITSVRAGGTCAPKKASQQLCLADQLKIMGANDDGTATDVNTAQCTTQPLTASKSALVLVVDDTQGHSKFFGKDVQDQLKAPLSDPAFESTDIGYLYSDLPLACDLRSVALKRATGAEGTSKIIADFTAKAASLSPSDDPNIEGALLSAYDALGKLDDSYARRAVVVLGNRKIDVSTCGDAQIPSQLAAAQLAKPTRPIATFATKLTNDQGDNEAAHTLADLGSPHDKDNKIPYQYNAVTPEDKKGALQAVINYLATCLYDVPVNVANQKVAPAADSKLSYANPLTAQEVRVEHVDACSGDKAGWTVDTTDAANPRVRICGSACTDYQRVLSDTSTFTLLYGQPAIPVPLYVSSKACYTK